MAETLSVEERIEAILFEYRNMYHEMMIGTDFESMLSDDEESASIFGGRDAFNLCVENFAKRFLPNAEPHLISTYSGDVSGQREWPVPTELRLFNNMTAKELAFYYLDASTPQEHMGPTDLEFFLRLAKAWKLDGSNLKAVQEFHAKSPEKLERLILTRGISHYKLAKQDARKDSFDTRLMANAKFCDLIEELVSRGVLPYSPAELQEFVDSYLMDRIRNSEDGRLIPFDYQERTLPMYPYDKD